VSKLLLTALDWAEVWALLIPLMALSLKRKQPTFLKPVIIYVWLALVINLVIDLIVPFKIYFPSWLHSNNPFYNIHSVVRFICFSIFFIQLPQFSFVTLKKSLAVFSIIFMLINFGFFENFFNPEYFSGNLLATEAYLLLIYCMQYYLSELRDDNNNLSEGPAFWVVTGLGIYVVINFFVFLFYVPMIYVDRHLAENIWNVHNIAFIIFCIFITKAFYGPVRNKYSV
jgi:hypothetical protein